MKRPVRTFAPIRTIGFVLSPVALSLMMLDYDRQKDQVSPMTQSYINEGKFWALAPLFQMPGLGIDRVPLALDYLQFGFPGNELCQLPGFSGDILALSPDCKEALPLPQLMAHENTLYYMEPKREIGWFDNPYGSVDQLIAEFKNGFGHRWPAQFDWARHVVEIYGIYRP